METVPTELLENIILFCRDILPGLVALAAVILSGITLSHSRKTQLTSTYFTEKTKVYGDYLDSVARFIFHPTNDARDNIASALYRVRLFASDEVLCTAEDVYEAAIQWSRSGGGSVKTVDDLVNKLGASMREDLASFDHR